MRETHETKLIFKVTQGINQRQILNREIRRITVDMKETEEQSLTRHEREKTISRLVIRQNQESQTQKHKLTLTHKILE